MELINEVPPIKVDGRIVACEGGMALSSKFSSLRTCTRLGEDTKLV